MVIALPKGIDKKEIDQLVKDYADSERSDTFVSYNDAIVLAKEVRRLRRQVRTWRNKCVELAYRKATSRV